MLVVRASKPIQQHETILVHYNPSSGIQSWGKVFKCTCCLCRGICGPTALLGGNTEQSFARLIQQAQHMGIRNNEEISPGDFVSTHQNDFWGNVEEPHSKGAKVRGFCVTNRKLISREVQATEFRQEVQKIKWKGAAKVLSLPAIAKVWAHKNHTTGSGGWLEDETIDAAIRWSLLGDTRMGGLAPCPGRNEYFSLETIQALQGLIQNYQEREDLSTTPLLQVALEGLTGINGNNYSSSGWTVSGANDGYVYINSGNLTLGTDTPNTTVKVHVGGTLAGNAHSQRTAQKHCRESRYPGAGPIRGEAG